MNYTFPNSNNDYVTVDKLTREEINKNLVRVFALTRSFPNDEILKKMLEILEAA